MAEKVAIANMADLGMSRSLRWHQPKQESTRPAPRYMDLRAKLILFAGALAHRLGIKAESLLSDISDDAECAVENA